MLEYLYFYVELIAFLCCIICYKKLQPNYKYFLPFLFFIILFEFACIKDWLIWHESNTWSINFECLYEFVFYSIFIIASKKKKITKRKITIAMLLCICLSLVDVFIIQGFWHLATIGILLQYSIMITLVCNIFYNWVKNADENMSLLTLPDFWVYTGLLFFCLIEFLFYSAYAYMVYKNNYLYYILFKVSSNVAVVVLYSFLSISFVCSLRTKKSSYY